MNRPTISDVRNKIFQEIEAEQTRQDHKWGPTFDWHAYITYYNRNAAYATAADEWRRQMVKVATLAVAAIEAFDRNSDMPPRHYER